MDRILALIGLKRHQISALRLRGRKVWREGGSWAKRAFYAVIIGYVVLRVWVLPIGQWADHLQLSTLTYLQGTRPVPSELILVGLDDKTLDYLKLEPGQPIPRRFLAEITTKTHRASPLILIMDFILPDEEDPANEAVIEALGAGKTVIGHGSETVLSFGKRVDIQTLSAPYFTSAAYMTIELVGRVYGPFHSYISLVGEPDASDEERVPLLGPLEGALGRDLPAPGIDDFTNFYGPPGTIDYISMADVMTMPAAELSARFKDKIVFFGFTVVLNESADTAKELMKVPGFNREMFGVEIHASRAGNLIDGSWIRRFSPKTEANIIFGTAAYLVFVALNMTPIAAVVFLSAAAFVWVLIAAVSFFTVYYFIPGAAFVALSVVLTVIVTLLFQAVYYKTRIHHSEKMFRTQFLAENWNEKGIRFRRLICAVLSAFAVLLLWAAPAGERVDRFQLSLLFEAPRKRAVPEDVIIVGIDDYAVQELGTSFKQPFPTDMLADAVSFIHQAGPRVLIADLLLSRELAGSDDALLEQALNSGPSVIGYRPDENDNPKNNIQSRFAGLNAEWIPLSYYEGEPYRSRIDRIDDRSAAEDKRFPLLRVLKTVGDKTYVPEPDDLINYYGRPGSIKRISLAELLRASAADTASMLKDKYVLLSYQTVMHRRELSADQQQPIPGFRRQMFDAEIHATILGNLRDDTYLRRLSAFREGAIVFAASLSILLIAALLPPVGAFNFALFGIIAWSGLTYYAFNFSYLFIPGLAELLIVLPIAVAGLLLVEAVRYARVAKDTEETLGVKILK